MTRAENESQRSCQSEEEANKDEEKERREVGRRGRNQLTANSGREASERGDRSQMARYGDSYWRLGRACKVRLKVEESARRVAGVKRLPGKGKGLRIGGRTEGVADIGVAKKARGAANEGTSWARV